MKFADGWRNLPEVSQWGSIDPITYMYNWGDRGSIVAVSILYQQKFREYRGMIVREELPNSNIDEWLTGGHGETVVESIINRIDVWDLIDAEDDLAIYLATWLRTGWQQSVTSDFPELSVTVEVNEGPNGYGLTLYRERG